MENRVTEQEVNDQGTFTDALDGSGNQFEDLGDFLDHVELGVRAFVREMLQQYAEDEFMRYMGG